MRHADHDAVVALYKEHAAIGPVVDWLTRQAIERDAGARDLSTTLIQAVCGGYGRALDAASHTMLLSEHLRSIDEAGLYIRLLQEVGQQGLPDLDCAHVREQAFAFLLKVVEPWWHFRKNSGDRQAREREQILLEEWLDTAGDQTPAYQAIIDVEACTSINDPLLSIRRTLSSRLASQSIATALHCLEAPGGVARLLRSDAPLAVRRTILDHTSDLWQPKDGSRALQLLATAAVQPSMQENARRLLDLVLMEGQRELSGGAAGAVEALLKSALLGSIWAAATATPLQFRQLKELRDLRSALTAAGADEVLMPSLPWLEAV